LKTARSKTVGLLASLGILATAALLWPRSGVDGPTHVVVLGVLADAGQPFPGCREACCRSDAAHRTRSSIALVEPETQRRWVFDATPDFPEQLMLLDELAPLARELRDENLGLHGLFLTSPAFGHAAGIDYLGELAASTRALPTYLPPGLSNQVVPETGARAGHVSVQLVADQERIDLAERLTVIPVRVPGTERLPERFAYIIEGPGERVLYAPSVGSWETWPLDFVGVLRRVNRALVDGTHFDREDGDHPSMKSLIALLDTEPEAERAKIHFIHLAHDNPALVEGSEAAAIVFEAGMHIARPGDRLSLY
jgi:pyrroloquinoline quinone biosynthesis protein B